ncbi:MAG: hypothetical protein M0006_07675 [Magnetospirillum sp.]|nr:hypothetical protein [Magnetospirillum sp.]
MRRLPPLALALSVLLSSLPAWGSDLSKGPPPAPYEPVSKLVGLPDFIPGLGTLYADPKTLPEGPYLAYDHHDNQVSTVYMIPLSDLEAHKDFKNLPAPGGKVDHMDLIFNPGHSGLEKPHYHIILWQVPVSGEKAVAK